MVQRNSLTLLSQGLADQVAEATDRQKRLACLALCKLAVNRMGLDEASVEVALRSLENGRYRDERVIAALKQLVEQLDEKYFAAKELYELGKEKKDTYLMLFRKARAANAVLLAFNDDPYIAATESIFEACTALDDIAPALAVLEGCSSK